MWAADVPSAPAFTMAINSDHPGDSINQALLGRRGDLWHITNGSRIIRGGPIEFNEIPIL